MGYWNARPNRSAKFRQANRSNNWGTGRLNRDIQRSLAEVRPDRQGRFLNDVSLHIFHRLQAENSRRSSSEMPTVPVSTCRRTEARWRRGAVYSSTPMLHSWFVQRDDGLLLRTL